MPNPGADRPLRKVTINLYEDDVIAAEKLFGRGWSEHLRSIWHVHLKSLTSYQKLKRTLGELE